MHMEDLQGNKGQIQLLLPVSTNEAKTNPNPNPELNLNLNLNLDLDLSMSIGTSQTAPLPPQNENDKSNCSNNNFSNGYTHDKNDVIRGMRELKQQMTEQVRLAAAERAYAERVREMARRELEMAEREFARARVIWERAREEVQRVERMKEMNVSRRMNNSPPSLEITCHACMQRFFP